MKYSFFLIIFLIIYNTVFSQNEINPNGYNIFYHENGKISSEGTMRDNKPDGYWKTYYEDGVFKSEGNRKDFELDSTWKFYDKNETLILEINYKKGKKNGIRKTYQEKEITEENFINDVKQGLTIYYYPYGKIKKSINFIDGLEQGLAKEYSEDGTIITLIEYKKGFIVNREKINRYDQQRFKHGKWKYFHKNGNLQLEGNYKHGFKNGYFKEYSSDGNLISTTKYVDDIKQEEVAELVKLNIRKNYYKNGKVKVIASYKKGIPEGIRREYSPEGKIERSYIFKNGKIIGEGIITEKGEKDGQWKEYYEDGNLKAEGSYNKDIKTGNWNFYHKNRTLEQEGSYTDKGKKEGIWKWYYDTGRLLREENFYNGLADGLMTEYDEKGEIITQGEFIEGLEDGMWFYEMGDHREEGEYIDGLRNGVWKYFFDDGKLSFEGKFIDDNPNGKHIYYWDNGNIKEEGFYSMGRKEGEWKKFDYEGVLLLVISYKNGIETKYDGIKIKSDFIDNVQE